MTTTNVLTRFGFKYEKGGAHIARTMMLDELRALLDFLRKQEAAKEEYKDAITEANCLGKRSGKTRILTYRHLVDLYALDPSLLLYRALLYFWNKDDEAQPLLALLCAYTRDAVLRSAAPFILKVQEGTTVTRESLEAFIDSQESNRFSPATLKSVAQNINATFTKSGHLHGKVRKVRTRAMPTAGSVAYALLLGYLTGGRGQLLFQTEYIKLLECSFDKAIELAEEASRKGWITFKRVGDVLEVAFPNVMHREEMEWLREQN